MAKKTWILRFRTIDRDNFLELKDGRKSVETRAASEKYLGIKAGDILTITCGRARIEKKVKRVRVFRSIGAMLKAIPYRRIMPSVDSVNGIRKIYYGYPGYREKLKQYGVIAFDLKPVSGRGTSRSRPKGK